MSSTIQHAEQPSHGSVFMDRLPSRCTGLHLRLVRRGFLAIMRPFLIVAYFFNVHERQIQQVLLCFFAVAIKFDMR